MDKPPQRHRNVSRPKNMKKLIPHMMIDCPKLVIKCVLCEIVLLLNVGSKVVQENCTIFLIRMLY